MYLIIQLVQQGAALTSPTAWGGNQCGETVRQTDGLGGFAEVKPPIPEIDIIFGTNTINVLDEISKGPTGLLALRAANAKARSHWDALLPNLSQDVYVPRWLHISHNFTKGILGLYI